MLLVITSVLLRTVFTMVFVSGILREHCKLMSKNRRMVIGYSQADLAAEEDEHILSEILILAVSCH